MSKGESSGDLGESPGDLGESLGDPGDSRDRDKRLKGFTWVV